MDVSISILTYNRPDILQRNLEGLSSMADELCEIIVVDNSTNDESQQLIEQRFPHVRYLRNPVNMGVAGRNWGLQEAKGQIVVTLDDDVTDLTSDEINLIRERFAAETALGGLCFRVLHFESGEICNWCHPRQAEVDGCKRFATYEISEGAVAYRKEALTGTGLYFEDYFISHEGKDLAYRIMNRGYRVEYDGRIWVNHCHAISGRTDWRRYYFDTRNAIWIAVRNMPPWYGTRFVLLALASMLVFSLRDGYVGRWLQAVWDGFRGIHKIRHTRETWTEHTHRLCRSIDAAKPGFLYMVRKRLFRRGVSI